MSTARTADGAPQGLVQAELPLGLVSDHVADTTDDWYTPPWLFKAAGLTFDTDVCAPVDPTRRTCPARTYLTPVEDGLTHPWQGVIWCNPPYSKPGPWVDRFATHDDGLLLVPAALSAWLGTVVAAADALTIAFVEFIRPDGRLDKPHGISLILAARGGLCAEALQRVAVADKHARGSYLVRPNLEQIPEPSPAAQETLL